MKILIGILILFLAAPIDLHQFGTHQEVDAQIDIDAVPPQVWDVLTDFATYTIWNPYIYPVKLSGNLEPGATLEVTLHFGGKVITYQPTITVVRPNEELGLKGRAYITGVFDRQLQFKLEPLGTDRTHLTSHEVFTGVLIPFYRGLVGDAQHGLTEMIEALKDRVELLHPAGTNP
jgi:hypothetical protein